MGIAINEAGALKSLNTSNYGSEMFIDDSLWQDKTLAELGFTEEMCYTTTPGDEIFRDLAATFKPFKVYQFGFRPKAIEISLIPYSYGLKQLDGNTYDNPIVYIPYTNSSLKAWTWCERDNGYTQLYFQMQGLPKYASSNNIVRMSTICGRYAVAGNTFGIDYGNISGSYAENVVCVTFACLLSGDSLTIYTAASQYTRNSLTIAEMLNKRFGVGSVSSNPCGTPIFMIKAYGG